MPNHEEARLRYSQSSSVSDLQNSRRLGGVNNPNTVNIPIEDYIAKYQVIKCSWRGKYERIFALTPTHFSTINPKDFEVTNTWALTSLIDITLMEKRDPNEKEGFILHLQGVKKEEQLKLQCRFRSHLLSDLYGLKDCNNPQEIRRENLFPCSKLTRLGRIIEIDLGIGTNCLLCMEKNGNIRSRYNYVYMEHLSIMTDNRDAFSFGYGGRSRVFYCEPNRRNLILRQIQEAARELGLSLSSVSNASTTATKLYREKYGKNIGNAFAHFPVQKITLKHPKSIERIISLHEKHFVELDADQNVVSCYEYADIHLLVRLQNVPNQFMIQFQSGQTREYVSHDRDGPLSALYDICVSCDQNTEVIVTDVANERGLKLLPFFAKEDAAETNSFFGETAISNCFLNRIINATKISGKDAGRLSIGDQGLMDIISEFNANVPPSGILYDTKQGLVGDSCKVLNDVLFHLVKQQTFKIKLITTTLQALYRIASSYYGCQKVANLPQFAESLARILLYDEEFVGFWATLLLKRLLFHSISNENSSFVSTNMADDLEKRNKEILLGNPMLLNALFKLLDGIEGKQVADNVPAFPNIRRIGPLITMAVFQTLETVLCSHKRTTKAVIYNQMLARVAEYYSTLMKLLFQSRCATTVEACTLLLRSVIDGCDTEVVARIRDAALDEGVVLRHLYQAIFDVSWDQRCISRYLVSLWMSHHPPAKSLLKRILPPGFLRFLEEPLPDYTVSLRLDQIEQEQMARANDVDEGSQNQILGIKHENSIYPDEDLSMMSYSSISYTQMDERIDDGSIGSRSFDFDGDSRTNFGASEISGQGYGEWNNIEPSAGVMISKVPTIDETGQEVHGQLIDTEFSKARMLNKLRSEVEESQTGDPKEHYNIAASNSNSSNKSQPPTLEGSNVYPKRKRDLAYKFISRALAAPIADTIKKMQATKDDIQGRIAKNSYLQGENFRHLFHMLSQNHYSHNIIWNELSRRELKHGLLLEIQRLSLYQNAMEVDRAYWNHEDFSIDYVSLVDEVSVEGCYLRLLCEKQRKSKSFPAIMDYDGTVSFTKYSESAEMKPKSLDAQYESAEVIEDDEFEILPSNEVVIYNLPALVHALYSRILRENIRVEYRDDLDITCLCVKSLEIVAAVYATKGDLGAKFEEMEYLITLITETKHSIIFESLLQATRALALLPFNARRLGACDRAMLTVIQLLQFVHICDRSSIAPRPLWTLRNPDTGENYGPLTVDDILEHRERLKWNDLSIFSVQRSAVGPCEPSHIYPSLPENLQLRYEVQLDGPIHPMQVAFNALSILISVADSNSLEHRNRENKGGSAGNGIFDSDYREAEVFPAPQAKLVLWKHIRKIIPILLRCNYNKVWDKIVHLIFVLYRNPVSKGINALPKEQELTNRSKLFKWGLFYMLFTSHSGNFEKVSAVLKATHLVQDGFEGRSALSGILPDGMIYYLTHHSAKSFAGLFCSSLDSPRVVWNEAMRSYLQECCILHLDDYKDILDEDASSEWLHVLLPPVIYDGLLGELYCGGVYLNRYMNDKYYEIQNPVEFMSALTNLWSDEMSRTRAKLSSTEARQVLNITGNASVSMIDIRKGFKSSMRNAQEFVITSKSYEENILTIQEAYRVLTCPRPSLLSDGHDPQNLLLILNSMTRICSTYGNELSSMEFTFYDLLLSILVTHCSSDSLPPGYTTARQRIEIGIKAAELLCLSTALSEKNCEHVDLISITKVIHYCVQEIVKDHSNYHNRLLDVCRFILKTVTRVVNTPRGRYSIVKCPTIHWDLVTLIWLWNRGDRNSYILSSIIQESLNSILQMIILPKNQSILFDTGLVWQLIMLVSTYDRTIDDIAALESVENFHKENVVMHEGNFHIIEREMRNIIAVLATRILSHLGNFILHVEPYNASPLQKYMQAVVNALLTPNLANCLFSSPSEFMSTFHSDIETYSLIWNQSMRNELLQYVQPKAEVKPSPERAERHSDTIHFRFHYVGDELALGGLYIKILLDTLKEHPRLGGSTLSESISVAQLCLNSDFYTELFQFIDNGILPIPSYEVNGVTHKLRAPYASWRIDPDALSTMHRMNALQVLSIICKSEPCTVVDAIVNNVDIIKTLLRLLFPPDSEVHESQVEGETNQHSIFPHEMYESGRELSLSIIHELSSFDKFGIVTFELGIHDILMEVAMNFMEICPQLLAIIQNLCTYGAASKFISDILQSGCYIEFIGWVVGAQKLSDSSGFGFRMKLMVPAAQVLGAMARPESPKTVEVNSVLRRFFPAAIIRAFTQKPQEYLEFYYGNHETPQFVWNQNFRDHLLDNVNKFLSLYYASENTSIAGDNFGSIAESFAVDYSNVYDGLMVGDVYVQMYLENPLWELHDPQFFIDCLFNEFESLFTSVIRASSEFSDEHSKLKEDSELFNAVTAAIVFVLRTYPWVAQQLPKKVVDDMCGFTQDINLLQGSEICKVNVARIFRVLANSRVCVQHMETNVTTIFGWLLSLINPTGRGTLLYESAFIVEIIRRIIYNYSDHGERQRSSGIVMLCLRIDMIGHMLDILERREGLVQVKEPQVLRAAAIDILNLLEKDKKQGSEAHQILKRHKPWHKKYRHEPTALIDHYSSDDPFMLKQYPYIDQKIAEHRRKFPQAILGPKK